MNEKFDRIFRKIAEEHESPFDPAEWENFKKLLENDKPTQISPSTSANPIFRYKNWAKVSVLAFLVYLLPSNLGHFQQNNNEKFAQKGDLKNNFNQNTFSNQNNYKNKLNIKNILKSNFENIFENIFENYNLSENQINNQNLTNKTKEKFEEKFTNQENINNDNSFAQNIIQPQKNVVELQSLSKNNTKENLVNNTKDNQEETIFKVESKNILTLSSILAKNIEYSLGKIPEFQLVLNEKTEIKKSPLVSVKFIATPLNTKHATHNIGLANFSSARGTQIALFTNQNTFVAPIQNAEELPIFQKRKFKAQISALLNLNSNDYQNLQISALANGACQIKGLQIAPLNVAGKVQGSQIGVVNITKKLKGIQFGLINIVDSIENGVPIGFMSFVKNGGYQKMEISAGDVFQTNLLGKMGTKKLYNIYSVASGYGVARDFRWALGFGFGKEISFFKKSAINAEFVAYHVNEQARFTRELNLLTQFRVQYNYQLSKGTNLYFGPTLNTMFSDFRNPDMTLGSQIAPYVIYQEKFQNSETSMKMWIGGNLGISF